MKYCKHCNVKISTDTSYCPLCYSEVSAIEDGGVDLCHKASTLSAVKKNPYKLVAKIFMMISLVAIVVCLLTDYLTEFSGWSILVILSIAYLWILGAHTILSTRPVFEKIILQIAGIMAVLWYTSTMSTGHWLMAYVYPSISMATVTSLLFVSFLSKERKNMFLSFTIICIILATISIIVLCLRFITQEGLVNLINAIYCVINVIGYLVFCGKDIKADFAKKMHL